VRFTPPFPLETGYPITELLVLFLEFGHSLFEHIEPGWLRQRLCRNAHSVVIAFKFERFLHNHGSGVTYWTGLSHRSNRAERHGPNGYHHWRFDTHSLCY